MERKNVLSKLQHFWRVGRFWVGIVIILAFSLAFGPKLHHWLQQEVLSPEGKWAHLSVSPWMKRWELLQAKVDEIGHALDENERLMSENHALRTRFERERFACEEQSARNKTQEISVNLKRETGTLLGRTLASITYEMPSQLLPPQIQALGVDLFEKGDYEKAAVVLSNLLESVSGTTYRTPRNYLLTAVAWYRLDNLALARTYLDRLLKMPTKTTGDDSNLKFYAHARLWMALIEKRDHQPVKSQQWLHQFIDNHPRSEEATWVNPTHTPAKAGRLPAQVSKNPHGHADMHAKGAHKR